jgi:hypothetical protein
MREILARYTAGLAQYEERRRATETPEETKAREVKEARKKAEIERRVQEALADPDVEEHRDMLVEMGLDEEEATRRARRDGKFAARYFPGESRETRRRQRIEHYRKYWEGPPP